MSTAQPPADEKQLPAALLQCSRWPGRSSSYHSAAQRRRCHRRHLHPLSALDCCACLGSRRRRAQPWPLLVSVVLVVLGAAIKLCWRYSRYCIKGGKCCRFFCFPDPTASALIVPVQLIASLSEGLLLMGIVSWELAKLSTEACRDCGKKYVCESCGEAYIRTQKRHQTMRLIGESMFARHQLSPKQALI